MEAECIRLRVCEERVFTLESEIKAHDSIIHDWEERYCKLQAKYDGCMIKLSTMSKKCKDFDVQINIHVEKCNKYETDIRVLTDECAMLREKLMKFDSVTIQFRECESKLIKAEERCTYLDSKLCELRDTYTIVCTERDRFRESHDRLHHVSEDLEYSRTELVRIRHMSKVKCAKLVERVVHLSKVIKELRSCFNKMSGICTCKVEDYTCEIDFEEIMVKSSHYEEVVRTRNHH